LQNKNTGTYIRSCLNRGGAQAASKSQVSVQRSRRASSHAAARTACVEPGNRRGCRRWFSRRPPPSLPPLPPPPLRRCSLTGLGSRWEGARELTSRCARSSAIAGPSRWQPVAARSARSNSTTTSPSPLATSSPRLPLPPSPPSPPSLPSPPLPLASPPAFRSVEAPSKSAKTRRRPAVGIASTLTAATLLALLALLALSRLLACLLCGSLEGSAGASPEASPEEGSAKHTTPDATDADAVAAAATIRWASATKNACTPQGERAGRC